ncbi:hypothetical protein SAMN05443574_103334 [Haloarcula vallismortis]|uniref:Uncharacterized protein n=2 Tax=Haloarcula vallismortis TaxID=28442 RepID=M0JUF6_HALVA|nr:hypothetical protein [Haloarcula vallismortis]EMA11594.1 hypothetical protein C437_01740 [Haloarcula vallismortis ATCC 29715]SDW45818.1 hypothetical protein SAMN05443574_103334 [Haloarcula vallismortis]
MQVYSCTECSYYTEDKDRLLPAWTPDTLTDLIDKIEEENTSVQPQMDEQDAAEAWYQLKEVLQPSD